MSVGWDDDDDLLALLDDEDVIVPSDDNDGVIAVAGVGQSTITNGNTNNNGSAPPPPLPEINPFLSNSDDDQDDNEVNEGMNGWDDDDGLEGLSSSSSENNSTTPQQVRYELPPPPPTPPRPASPPLPPPLAAPLAANAPTTAASSLAAPTKLYADIGRGGATERTFALLQEHEAIMDEEIERINTQFDTSTKEEDVDGVQHNLIPDDDNNENGEGGDDWDFDEDDDIFNEENDELPLDDNVRVGDGNNAGMSSEARSALEVAPRHPPPPPTALTTAANAPKVCVEGVASDQQPKPVQQLNDNPFLSESDEMEENQRPEFTPTTGEIGENNITGDDAGDDDGWSDEDFFEDDPMMMEVAPPEPTPRPAGVPPPPPHPAPTPPTSTLSPPISQRTRARTAARRTAASRPRAPSPVPLNPTQMRIHQMLCGYISTLHDPNYLSRLHQELRMYQQEPSSSNDAPTNSAAADLTTYYTTRPGLRKYTLGVELTRMDYSLVLPNGKSVNDKDVIRSYFGVDESGEDVNAQHPNEGEVVSTEELLVRSANQSLLADMLVALTGSEDDIVTDNGLDGCSDDDFFDEGKEYQTKKVQSTGLILSGPTLCMASVAESCQFNIDLMNGLVEGVCRLAISVPFHDDATSAAASDVVQSGRLVLARAQVSVRFRPGEAGSDIDEPTVQYAVQSVTPYHSTDSALLQKAAISLAHDQADPFFHDEYADVDAEGATSDARDRFLLSHHLLSDTGLLVVTDHIDRLRDAAEASSTGFRSALRQLDGVTNVSGKLSGLKGATSGFGLVLPSVEEIEAAEREAVAAALDNGGGQYSRPPPPPDAPGRFPRPQKPERVANNAQPRKPPPPPPPPPLPPQEAADSSRPRPLIGGLFMSGLSRLAAAATQPDEMQRTAWESGGTGLTPPGSPRNGANQQKEEEHLTFYRREENEHDIHETGGSRGYSGLTPMAASEPTRWQEQETNQIKDSTAVSTTNLPPVANQVGQNQVDELYAEQDDAGWSDDEFEFEDAIDGEHDDEVCNKEAVQAESALKDEVAEVVDEGSKELAAKEAINTVKKLPTPKPAVRMQPSKLPGGPKAPVQLNTPIQPQRTFEEEFVIVLKEKIEAENRETKETGRMKRWTPISEDPLLRERLKKVMMAQIHT